MRKVKFKTWIPIEHKLINGLPGTMARVEGTGQWSNEYSESGLFHKWASTYEEFENGAGNYTVAIVELPDGSIKEVLPICIKFDDKPSEINNLTEQNEKLSEQLKNIITLDISK